MSVPLQARMQNIIDKSKNGLFVSPKFGAKQSKWVDFTKHPKKLSETGDAIFLGDDVVTKKKCADGLGYFFANDVASEMPAFIGSKSMVVSEFHRAKCSITDRVSFRDVEDKMSGDSYYIPPVDCKTSVAVAKSGSTKYMVSDRFGGCVFQLWRVAPKKVLFAHIYEGDDEKEDTFLSCTKSREAKGWEPLCSLKFDKNVITSEKDETGTVVVEIAENHVDIAIFVVDSKCKAIRVIDADPDNSNSPVKRCPLN